jgi:hypothetical protein
MGKRVKSIVLGIVAFAVLFGLATTAQAVPYAVGGTVFDTEDNPVNGVDVTVTWLETGQVQTDITDAEGRYLVSLMISDPDDILGDTIRIVADAGDGRTNTTEVTATKSPLIVHLTIKEHTPPITTITAITPEPNNYGWNNVTPVTVSFDRSDDSSGVAYTNYSTTIGGPWTTEPGEDPFDIAITTEGVTTIWYYSVDNAENIEDTKSVDIKIDLTEPTVMFIDPTPANESVNTTGYVNVTVEVTDPAPGSGLEDVVNISVWNETELHLYGTMYDFDTHRYYYNVSSLDGTPLPDGNYTYEVYAKDLAGNMGVSETRVVKVNVTEIEYSFTIEFAMDYNIISIPVNDTSVTDAASLATKIGDNCTQISKWDAVNQEYVTYLPAIGIDNFDVVGGEGYEVVMTGPETVPFEGKGWESPFTLSLLTDYNIIGIPVNDTSVTDAASLATKIGDNCTQISKWDAVNQEYVTYLPAIGIDNFDVVGGEGYEVVMTDPETVPLEGGAWSN